jgi:hypothetical protein
MEKDVTPPKLRTGAELDQEYANICVQIGDKVVKIDFLQTEISVMRAKCKQLDDEKKAYLALQASEKKDVAATN